MSGCLKFLKNLFSTTDCHKRVVCAKMKFMEKHVFWDPCIAKVAVILTTYTLICRMNMIFMILDVRNPHLDLVGFQNSKEVVMFLPHRDCLHAYVQLKTMFRSFELNFILIIYQYTADILLFDRQIYFGKKILFLNFYTG
ncbi:hypothetical protein ACJX0J_038505, partial [Zea mays]